MGHFLAFGGGLSWSDPWLIMLHKITKIIERVDRGRWEVEDLPDMPEVAMFIEYHVKF